MNFTAQQEAIEKERRGGAKAAEPKAVQQPAKQASDGGLFALQRTAGNRAVDGLFNSDADSDGVGADSSMPPVTSDALKNRRGQPLDPNTRKFMEARFGTDFSQVRVHEGTEAGESARSVNAQAYTIGQDVVFDTGQYVPKTTNGRLLLAHELTHTLQQRRQLQRSPLTQGIGRSNDPHEYEASRIAQAVVGDGFVPHVTPASATLSIQRAEESIKLEDVSGQYGFSEYETDGMVCKEARGRLGEPDKVLTHRSPSAQRKVSKGTGDDAGHLIGDRFGPPGGAANLSPQNWIANEYGTFKKLESDWAAKRAKGIEIDVIVRDMCRKGEDRPFWRKVEWVETGLDGSKTPGKLDFLNTHTPESRKARGIPSTTSGNEEADVIDMKTRKRLRPANKTEGAGRPKIQTETSAESSAVEAAPAPVKAQTSPAKIEAAATTPAQAPGRPSQSTKVGAAPTDATSVAKALQPSGGAHQGAKGEAASLPAKPPAAATVVPAKGGPPKAQAAQRPGQPSGQVAIKESHEPFSQRPVGVRQPIAENAFQAGAVIGVLIIELADKMEQARLHRETLQGLTRWEEEYRKSSAEHPDDGVLVVQTIEFGIADVGKIGYELVAVGVGFGGKSIEEAMSAYYRNNLTAGPPAKNRFQERHHTFWIWRNGSFTISKKTLQVDPVKND